MRIVFWQNMVALHQSAHVRALAAKGHDVTFVAEVMISLERQAMGWRVPDLGQAKVVVTRDSGYVRELVAESPDDAVHVIGGVRGYRIGWVALECCLKASRRVGFLSEGADPRGWKGSIRRILYRDYQRGFHGRIDFILAMGQLGVRWFRQVGYPEATVFPYAYLTERPTSWQVQPAHADIAQTIDLLYLGQCIPRKGIDTALRALGNLCHMEWRLTVLGDGPMRPQLEKMASCLGIQSRVRFLPFLPYSQALQILALSDLLVLPSRFDGWGAVVNEALMSGVPVICSDRCGASDLLRESWRGGVFDSESEAQLTQLLAQWMIRGKLSAELREKIKGWSHCIQGDAGADYLLTVFECVYGEGPRPEPPWYSREC
jgi:glycosyltransferase involved in cell wall biosynthesis